MQNFNEYKSTNELKKYLFKLPILPILLYCLVFTDQFLFLNSGLTFIDVTTFVQTMSSILYI